MAVNKPCAYCGSTQTARHLGHIVAYSLYPNSTPTRVQRPTVPECEDCRNWWTDSETQFRNILTIAGEPNQEAQETWQTVLRSFRHPSGPKWLADVWNAMTPVQTPSGIKHMVHPYRDPRVNLVLRKIVRGLSAYHEIRKYVPDQHVLVGYVPDIFTKAQFESCLIYDLGIDFVAYGMVIFEEPIDIESIWCLRFYGNRDFLGVVTTDKTEVLRE